MAEGPERVQVNKRGGGYHNRGRSAPNRVLDKLGVKDLREHLDKKRDGRNDYEGNAPPPDPNSYLNDPSREPHHPHHQRPSNRRPNNNRNENASQQQTPTRNKPHHQNLPLSKDIENPINIKIEFSTSTGEHTYELDEQTVLPTIKHVPDKKPIHNRNFRGRGGSFRGRGRGRGNYKRQNNKNPDGSQLESEQDWEKNDQEENVLEKNTNNTEEVEKNDKKEIEENQNEVSGKVDDNNTDEANSLQKVTEQDAKSE